MLKQRVITAAILLPLVLLFLFYASAKVFLIVSAFLFLAAFWEWSNLIGVKDYRLRIICLTLNILFMYGLIYVYVPWTLGLAFIWWWLAIVMLVFYPKLPIFSFIRLPAKLIIGFLLVGPCWVSINFIRAQSPGGIYNLLYLFILIWGADTAAYFVGKQWGKHKLAPLISPGKSVEGLFGAILFGIAASLTVAFYTKMPISYYPYLFCMSLVTILFSIMGDLFESMVKRQAGLKDSGSILPGHGGILDRIDSLTAAAPVYALLWWFFYFEK